MPRRRPLSCLFLALAVAPLGLALEAATVTVTTSVTRIAPGGGDDLTIRPDLGNPVVGTINPVITLDGAGSVVTENTLSNDSGQVLTTLTINSVDASLRTLVVGATTLANGGGQRLDITGSANFRPGLLSTGSWSNVQLVKNGGTGELILDAVGGSDLSGAMVRVISGTLSVEGGGGILSPIASLYSALQIDGASGKLRLGTPSAAGTTFSNSLIVNDSGTLEHSAASNDTLDGSMTIATGKTLNANITAGSLVVTGNLFGNGLIKIGGGDLRFTNPSTLDALAVNGGRIEFNGLVSLGFTPVIAAGGTLAFTSSAGTNSLPSVFNVPSGTLELVPGGLGLGSNKVSLTGGTLKLAAAGLLTNAVTAAGNSGIAVGVAASQLDSLTLQPGTVLNKTAGGLTVANLVFASAGIYTLGVTGGDFTVAASAGSGAVKLVKTGAGTLNLNGLQGFQTLDANSGVTNVNSSATGGTATVNANATTNFAVSQTLAALNIGAGAVVTLNASAPFAAVGGAATAVVPEPSALGMLAVGAVGLLSRRRRTSGRIG